MAPQWLLEFNNAQRQGARWIKHLQEYDFDTEHRAGLQHRKADALSQSLCPTDRKHWGRLDEKMDQLCITATWVDDLWTAHKLARNQ